MRSLSVFVVTFVLLHSNKSGGFENLSSHFVALTSFPPPSLPSSFPGSLLCTGIDIWKINLFHILFLFFSDLIEQFGCHDTEFRLSCKSLTASIAIFKATFSATPLKFSHASCQPSNQSIDPNDCNTCPTNNCGSENSFGNNSRNVGEVNFRHAINRRYAVWIFTPGQFITRGRRRQKRNSPTCSSSMHNEAFGH